MTVIVYDGETLAADSGIFLDTTVTGRVHKIFDVEDGTVIACAGVFADIMRFRDWLNRGADQNNRPADIDLMNAIQIFPDGSCQQWDEKLFPFEASIPFVCGGGMDFALGALSMGAGAVKAVEVACEHYTHAKLPVHSRKIVDLPETKTAFENVMEVHQLGKKEPTLVNTLSQSKASAEMIGQMEESEMLVDVHLQEEPVYLRTAKYPSQPKPMLALVDSTGRPLQGLSDMRVHDHGGPVTVDATFELKDPWFE